MTNLFKRFNHWLERQNAAARQDLFNDRFVPRPPASNTQRFSEARIAEIAEAARRAEREVEVIALADAARDAYLADLTRMADEKAEAYTFEIRKSGTMLTIVSNDTRIAVNLAFLNRVEFTPGGPVSPDRGLVIFDQYDWRFSRWGERPVSYTSTRNAMEHTIFGPYPSPDSNAKITFVGVETMLFVPHARSQQVFDDILAVIAS